MLQSGSVSHWIQLFKEGERSAAQPLWERYHLRIVGLARKFLQQSTHRHADEEDIAQEAFNSFFVALERGRFPQLTDRQDLWRLLVVITKRKSIDQVRRARCRVATSETGDPIATFALSDADLESDLEQIVAADPTPEMAVQLIEEYERLLAVLEDAKLRQIAVWKLQAFTNDQIGAKLNCSRRTVIRKLETIRLLWKDAAVR
jgi:RNA polymerase sigma factor (sigma-70 family)